MRKRAAIFALSAISAIGSSTASAGPGATCSTVPTTNLDMCFESLYAQLVANPAVLGIELSVKALSDIASPERQILGGGQFTVAVTGADFSSGTAVFDEKFPGPLPEGCPWTTIRPSCKHCKEDKARLFSTNCLGSCVPAECLAAGLTLTSTQASAPASKLSTSDLMSPEQGMYYVLRSLFAGTAVAPDFLYAYSHPGSPATISGQP